jgi:hypothetical protein
MFFFSSVQTGCGVHPASYTMGTGALSPRVKRPGHEADLSPTACVEVRNSTIRHHGVVLN